jgi:hypothetical protein
MDTKYEVQRYRYGQAIVYTAFALVPWVKPVERTLPSGVRVTMGNGPKNPHALHFRTFSHLFEHVKSNKMNVINLSDPQISKPLSGTKEIRL